MADKKKKAPAKPFIGYGTDVKAGKAITKSVKKAVVKKVAKAGTVAGKKVASGMAGSGKFIDKANKLGPNSLYSKKLAASAGFVKKTERNTPPLPLANKLRKTTKKK